MLSKKIQQKLNEQVALEGSASSIYLAMASWCERQGLQGCANFFYDQSDEERMHMIKIVKYINEMDGAAVIPAMQQPANDYASIQEVFKVVYEQEKHVTASIYQILSLSQEENDHSTALFMQWYVAEQREEEAQVRNILDAIKLIGAGGQSLYYIDKEVQKINNLRAVETEDTESV